MGPLPNITAVQENILESVYNRRFVFWPIACYYNFLGVGMSYFFKYYGRL